MALKDPSITHYHSPLNQVIEPCDLVTKNLFRNGIILEPHPGVESLFVADKLTPLRNLPILHLSDINSYSDKSLIYGFFDLLSIEEVQFLHCQPKDSVILLLPSDEYLRSIKYVSKTDFSIRYANLSFIDSIFGVIEFSGDVELLKNIPNRNIAVMPTYNQMPRSMYTDGLPNVLNKISYETLKADIYQICGQRSILLTTGTYDLTHMNHIWYLHTIKQILPEASIVVAMDTDEWVRTRKGPTRPIQEFSLRANNLASYPWIDVVIPHSGDNLSLINSLTPFCFAMSFSTKQENPESRLPDINAVKMNGGVTIALTISPYILSTSEIIKKSPEP